MGVSGSAPARETFTWGPLSVVLLRLAIGSKRRSQRLGLKF